jgi:tetratricopeptide (TPR) repeat protein
MPVDSVARLGLGTSYRVKGEANYRLGDSQAAGEYMQRAVDTLEAAVQPLTDAGEHRFLAQVYQGLGSVYEWKAFLAGQDKSLYIQAIAYYDRCIQQGALFPVDTFLREEVVARLCVPYRDRLNQAYGAEQ